MKTKFIRTNSNLENPSFWITILSTIVDLIFKFISIFKPKKNDNSSSKI